MMRRVRWLLIGAVAGIAAYRRLGRAARGLLAPPSGNVPLPPRQRPLRVIPFLRDVRAGMAEYAALRADTPRISPAQDRSRRRYFDRRTPGPGNSLASHVTDNAKDGP
jgi:uncharacterized membrane protein